MQMVAQCVSCAGEAGAIEHLAFMSHILEIGHSRYGVGNGGDKTDDLCRFAYRHQSGNRFVCQVREEGKGYTGKRNKLRSGVNIKNLPSVKKFHLFKITVKLAIYKFLSQLSHILVYGSVPNIGWL